MTPSSFRIREIREAKKLSGIEVAQNLNISPQYYYDIEKGKRNLSADIASKLASYFDVSIDYLLGRTDNPNPYPVTTLAAHKTDGYDDDLTEEEQNAVRAFIETYRKTIGKKSQSE